MPPGATLVDRFAARTDENLVLAYVEAHVGTVPDKAAMLVRLIVHPCYRRRGVAKTFVRRVLDGLSESGIARVSLFAKTPQYCRARALPFAWLSGVPWREPGKLLPLGR